MKQELIQRTAREWVHDNPSRGARDLTRLGGPGVHAGQTAEEIADALIRLAGRMELAETRAW